MKRSLRVFTLGLLLGTAPMLLPQFSPVTPAMAQSGLELNRSVEWYKARVGDMDRRTLRAYIDALKANRTAENRRLTRAKIDVFRDELQRRKAERLKKKAERQKQKLENKRQKAEDKQQARKKRQQDKNLSAAERTARSHLQRARQDGNPTLQALNLRISRTQDMLQWQDVQRDTRNQLEALLREDKRVYRATTGRDYRSGQTIGQDQQQNWTNQQNQQRQQTQQTQDQDIQTAEGVLADRRSSDDLSTDELRNRVQRNRTLLRSGRFEQRHSTRLRERLRADRRELRQRLEARRTGQDGFRQRDQRQFEGRLLSGDVRPSHALRTARLSARVHKTRDLLARDDLTYRERTRLLDLLESDRRELRSRLRHRRDRRRGDLSRWLRNNEINIVIAPPSAYAPRDDIAFAEVDDELIERQLVAPPRYRIDRRYSFDEYRRQPDLRHAMPAIDVDSINFGFNESFVREEEIDQLERLGAVIERIVAKNPGEVFLIEGHTDAVGSPEYNLRLSRERAEAVRRALLDYFVIDQRNLETIGYGEQYLKIPTPEAEEENRRVSVRRITPLLAGRQ